ncbi:MAG: DEAD/DEAH box helicase [Candidatus Eisenbacteria bacterium]|uniref:DEAD/DEAH box helicase n=1 Tax=Eiseniibacteriota bacterium TaxID=2212470 RepID=A0A538U9P2_UNCEI|nr:MAG: DEAD/DEAH box helicase [Candidatus Eisenbacteria bacterium]
MQAVYPVPRHLKAELLNEILTRNEVRSVIVYANTRHAADHLARQLQKRGHTVASLHDSDNQMQRERAVNDLKRGRIHILLATDLASRGIVMDGISHVVNFDVPSRPEDYLHRIGHSTNAHSGGDAFTLMSPEEAPHVAAIERYLGRTVPRVLLPDFDYRMRPTEMRQVVSYPSRERPAAPKPAPKPAAKPAPKPPKPAAKSNARPGSARSVGKDGTRPRATGAASSRTPRARKESTRRR